MKLWDVLPSINSVSDDPNSMNINDYKNNKPYTIKILI